jgi:phage tail sheath protein FI
MVNYRSPGVYVEELSLLPPSIAEVESAVPAFVGYTEKAQLLAADDLLFKPTRISSISDYIQYFGGADKELPATFDIDVDEIKSGVNTLGFKVTVTPNTATLSKYKLYHAVRLFYANGGGSCYITSVGKYPDAIIVGTTTTGLAGGLNAVANEDAPTMLLVPDAVNLGAGDFNSINQTMLTQASTLKDRFALLDTRQTTVPKMAGTIDTDVKTATDGVPSDNSIRRYGAVYYPFLETTYNYTCDFDTLLISTHTVNAGNPTAAVPAVVDRSGALLSLIKVSASVMYNAIQTEFQKYHIVLPPSAAIAGAITRVDNDRGYWKAPANVGLLNVMKPVISISRGEQDLLNINTETGKSVDAILSLPGYGPVIMGARTLDGNDNEWKYINVRRFFSIVGESVKKSTSWAIFEPNTASTWTKVQAMIENYLYNKWRDGALAGATPKEAFFVRVGLNKTMNSIDILEGRMIVEIGMAVARPAEFIILRFEQMMQTS